MKHLLLVIVVMMLCSCQMELKGNSVNYYEKTEGLRSIVDSDSRLTLQEKSVLLLEEFDQSLKGTVLYENEVGTNSTFSIDYLRDVILDFLYTTEYEAVEYFDGQQRICVNDQFCFGYNEKEPGYSLINDHFKVGYVINEEDREELEDLFETLWAQRFFLDHSNIYDYDGTRQSNVPFLEHEANEVFVKGFSAMTLFTKRLLPVSSVVVYDEDGNTYYRTAEQRFQYYDDFKEYLLGVFTEELVERVLSMDENGSIRYLDIDGYTALIYGEKLEGPIDTVEYTLLETVEDRVVFEVLAQQLDSKEEKTGIEYRFVVEMVKDQTWKISDFSVR